MPKSGIHVHPNGMAGTIQRPMRAALAWLAGCSGYEDIYEFPGLMPLFFLPVTELKPGAST
jgi:hypothetical protein